MKTFNSHNSYNNNRLITILCRHQILHRVKILLYYQLWTDVVRSQRLTTNQNTLNKHLCAPHYPARTSPKIFYFFIRLQNNITGLLDITNPRQHQPKLAGLSVFKILWEKNMHICSHCVLNTSFVNLFFEQKYAPLFSYSCLGISWITLYFGVRTSAVLCFPYILKAMKITVTGNSSVVYT